MALYELEDRVFFDGAMPTDIVQAEANAVSDNGNVNADAGSFDDTEAADNADNANSADADGGALDADVQEAPAADANALDFIDDISGDIGDFQLERNVLLVSTEAAGYENIVSGASDDALVIEYGSGDNLDAILQRIKDGLGDSGAGDIGIFDADGSFDLQGDDSSALLDGLSDLQMYGGEINLISVDADSGALEISDCEAVGDSSWDKVADADNDASDYFSDDFTPNVDVDAQDTTDIYFIDSGVEDIDSILSEVPDGAVVVELGEGEGLDAISAIIEQYENIDSVHIISQGNYAQILVGNDVITADNISEYQGEFSEWRDNLAADADILFYGCDIAKAESGQGVVGLISEWTGADVAASTDITGGVESNGGGDWDLEYSTGTIEAAALDVAAYDHHLETYTVTAITDNGAGSTTGSLSWAVAQSNGTTAVDDNINFNLTSGDTVTLSNNHLYITDGVTIDGTNLATGNNVTVQVVTPGTSTYRVFFINSSSDTVNIRDMTVKGGDVSGDSDYNDDYNGGGIRIAGGALTLTNVTITGSKATRGGGVYANRTTTLTNCTITGNTAKYGGGFAAGGTSGIITLKDSTFNNNTSTRDGGGIYFNTATVNMEGCTVSGNSSTSYGGGISGLGSFPLTITDSTISNNTAGNYGGGFSLYADVTFIRSTVSGNTANEAGGVRIQQAGLTATDSAFSGNTASAGRGGGIYFCGSSSSPISGSLTNCNISGNTASSIGGGINASTGVLLDLVGCTISGNSANTCGGGVYANGAPTVVNLVDTTISGNTSGGGGGIYGSSGNMHLVNSIVINNTDTNNANQADILNQGITITAYYSWYNKVSGAVNGGNNVTTAYTAGDLAALADNGGYAQTMAINPALGVASGGCKTGSYTSGSTTKYAYHDGTNWCAVEDGSAVVGVTRIAADGRGYYQTDGAISMGAYQNAGVVAKVGEATSWTGGANVYTDIQSAYNAAADGNAVVLANTSILVASEIDIGNTKSITIKGETTNGKTEVRVTNQASTASRIFDIEASGKTIALQNMAVKGGDISGDSDSKVTFGGGIYIAGGTVNLTSVTVRGSTAYKGGGIYVTGAASNVTLESCTISDSKASMGGAMFLHDSCTVTLNSSTLADNSVNDNLHGKACYGGGAILANASVTLNATGTTFSNNSTLNGLGAYGGGAIRFDGGAACSGTFTNCTFSGNTSNTNGGTICIENGSFTFSGCTITASSSLNRGGAIFITGASSSVTLSNTTVSNSIVIVASSAHNDIYSYGGGICAESGSTVTLNSGSTVTGNMLAVTNSRSGGNSHAYGGGIYASSATVNINGGSSVTNNTVLSAVTNSSFARTAEAYGGGICVSASTLNITGASSVTGNSVKATTTYTSSNYAQSYGGGLSAISSSAVTVDNSTVSNNTASATYVYSGDVRVANPYGGGISIDSSSLDLRNNSTVSGNTGKNGGGIAILSSSSGVTMANSVINGNHALMRSYPGSSSYTGIGGALYAESSTLTVSGCDLSGNDSYNAGGVYAYSSTINFSGSTISGNTFRNWGGGMYVSASTINLSECAIANNTTTSGYYGGGIYARSSAVISLVGSTVTGNNCGSTGSGAGLYLNSSTLYLASSIVAYNARATTSYSDIGRSGSTVYANYSISSYNLTGSGSGNIRYTYSSGKGASLFSDYSTVSANSVYRPVLADNGGSTKTVKLADDSIAGGAGCMTGTYTDAGATKYVFSSDGGTTWYKIEDGTTTVASGSVTKITTDQRGETLEGKLSAGSYFLPICYYKSNASGNWSDGNTWLVSFDGSTWATATSKGLGGPATNSLGVTILNGHTVTVNADASADQMTVDSGGTLSVASGRTLTVVDGSGMDLTANGNVSVAGTLLINSGAAVDSNAGFSASGTVSFNAASGSDNGSLSLAGAGVTIAGLTAGAGTVTYDGTNQAVAAVNYYNLALSGSDTKTSTGTIGARNLTVGNGVTLDTVGLNATTSTTNSGTMKISGSAEFGSSTTSVGGTVNYDGADQTVDALGYNNLTLSGSGTKTVNMATTTISGTGVISGSAKATLGVSVTADDKAYDGTTAATANLALSNIFTDYSNVSLASTSSAFAQSDAGTGLAVNVSGISISGTDAGKFALASTSAATTANITKADLSIIVQDVTKVQGQALENETGFTDFTTSGLAAGESISSVTLEYGTGAQASAAVGTYDDQVTAASPIGSISASNYNITYVKGDIIVTPIPVANTGSTVNDATQIHTIPESPVIDMPGDSGGMQPVGALGTFMSALDAGVSSSSTISGGSGVMPGQARVVASGMSDGEYGVNSRSGSDAGAHDGEYGMQNRSAMGGLPDGEYGLGGTESGGSSLGGDSDILLLFDEDELLGDAGDVINFEAIEVSARKHPAFMNELDRMLEMV